MDGFYDIIEIPPDLREIMEAEVPITEEETITEEEMINADT